MWIALDECDREVGEHEDPTGLPTVCLLQNTERDTITRSLARWKATEDTIVSWARSALL